MGGKFRKTGMGPTAGSWGKILGVFCTGIRSLISFDYLHPSIHPSFVRSLLIFQKRIRTLRVPIAKGQKNCNNGAIELVSEGNESGRPSDGPFLGQSRPLAAALPDLGHDAGHLGEGLGVEPAVR